MRYELRSASELGEGDLEVKRDVGDDRHSQLA